jgi:hypothetical protein
MVTPGTPFAATPIAEPLPRVNVGGVLRVGCSALRRLGAGKAWSFGGRAYPAGSDGAGPSAIGRWLSATSTIRSAEASLSSVGGQ